MWYDELKSSPVASGTSEFDVSQNTIIYVEGYDPSISMGDQFVQQTYKEGTKTLSTDRVTLTSEDINLDAGRVKDDVSREEFNEQATGVDAWLPDDREKKAFGVYIPVNNDDDDYDGKQDRKQGVWVSDIENDLVPLRITPPKPNVEALGDYAIARTPNLRIWQKVGGQYIQLKGYDRIPAEDDIESIQLFLEATDTRPDSWIRLRWIPEGEKQKPVEDKKIYVHPFEAVGPRNVPNCSKYTYSVDGGAGNGDSEWLTPKVGTSTIDDATATDQTDTQLIFWDNEDAAIGKARYQASQDYTWAFDVNVVDIDLGASSVVPNFNPVLADTGAEVQIASNPPGTGAIVAQQTVTAITGPTRVTEGDNRKRGVEMMQIGFIQLLTATQYNATYTSGHTASHIMEGLQYLDAEEHALVPWYDDKGKTTEPPGPDISGDGLLTGNDFTKHGQTNVAMADRPISYFLVNHAGETLQTGTWQWNFDLVIAVGTSDLVIENGAGGDPEYPFFRRAEQTWSFSGTIGLAGGQYVVTAGSVTSAGNSLTEVKAGNRAFVDDDVRRDNTTGNPIIVNDALNNGEGSTPPWP